jgi:dTDP-4-amino-4,6-dideoxygalactose transaminase
MLSRPGGEALTTPYSFKATSSALERAQKKLIFHDIEARTLQWRPPQNISKNVNLIAPVHIYGIPSNTIHKAYDIPVIYDSSHAFNCWLNGRHILSFGDASVISFHSTKLFHTCEGGGIVFKEHSAYLEAKDRVSFGLKRNDHKIATNAKMSELHCAMGLAVLNDIHIILEKRQLVKDRYDTYLKNRKYAQKIEIFDTFNYLAYYPIMFESRLHADSFITYMNSHRIECRQYFNLSLNQIYSKQICEYSEKVAGSIVCLPFHTNLSDEEIDFIIKSMHAYFN